MICIKNNFKKEKDYVVIYLDRRSGEKLECKISHEDFERVINFPYKWFAGWCVDTQTYYAQTTIYIGQKNGDKRKSTSMVMQSFIMNNPKGTVVDHIDFDTLNNQRYNLRVVNVRDNLKHRRGKNKNNKSGYRNVCWDKRKEKWIVQLQVNCKNKVLGKFDDVDEAGEFAEEMREKYYGEFKGSN